MRVREIESSLIAFLSVSAAMGVVLSSDPVLQTLCGLPLVLLLPGYAILRVALPEARSTLAGAVFAIGLSIVITVFAGLALHSLRAMNSVGWAFALCMITVVASCVARFRSPPMVADEARYWPRLRRGQAMMLICAAVVAAGAVVLAQQGALARREFAYTEFWMVPTPQVQGSVTIGFKNAEEQSSSYDVEVMLDEKVVAVWNSILLQTGQSWTTELAMPLGHSGAKNAKAWLFKNGDRGVIYRRVWLKATL
jgi:uncharacterized membrane protein